ncbi:MAG: VCBS repeat-containing protein, partial [Bdellovibrionota bacterium]
VADLDGDRKEDLIFRHSDGRVQGWLMNGYALKAAGDIGAVASNWKLRGIGDYNGDGKVDLLYREVTGPMKIWFMNGLSTTSIQDMAHTGTNPLPTHGIKASGDFDGDGKADLVFMNGAGEFFFWKMNGANSTLDPQTYTQTTQLIATSSDVNYNGVSDLILSGNAGGTNWLYIWYMSNMKVTGGQTVRQIEPGWSVVMFDRY